jgi:pyruvate/2-oxoglutarate dehydrogenase complex dihydrolipoamide acyltransferase (E2) component
VLLILGAVLSWLVERPAPASRPTQPPVSTAPPPASAEPAPAAAAPPAEVAPAPEKPREIVGYRDVRVPGKPLAECMGPDREIGPEVLRCRDGYTKREPIYR